MNPRVARMVTELRDISFVINSPMTIGLKDVDGDIATLVTDTLFAKGSDEQAQTTLPNPPVFVPQEKDSTYMKRWMYFYLSSIMSPRNLRGWGELAGRVGNVRGGGTVSFYQMGSAPKWISDTE